MPTSFHRHTLRQIPRLIHIAASSHGDVVRQQLERHHFQNGKQQLVALWDVDDMLDHLSNVRVAFDGDGDDAAGAGADFLDVA
jgi:hypothetical protein